MLSLEHDITVIQFYPLISVLPLCFRNPNAMLTYIFTNVHWHFYHYLHRQMVRSRDWSHHGCKSTSFCLFWSEHTDTSPARCLKLLWSFREDVWIYNVYPLLIYMQIIGDWGLNWLQKVSYTVKTTTANTPYQELWYCYREERDH